jgi:hypothetical protein
VCVCVCACVCVCVADIAGVRTYLSGIIELD